MDAHVTGLVLAEPVEALAAILIEQGHCDSRTIDRARRVAAESGQRLDRVLMQLGLVTERGLAAGFAAKPIWQAAPPWDFFRRRRWWLSLNP